MKKMVRAGVIIGCIVFVSHASFFTSSYLWLDHGDIENGRAVVSPVDAYRVFFMRYGMTGYYRPMFTLFHGVNSLLFGAWIPGYHIMLVFLHAVVSVLSIVLYKKWFGIKDTPLLLIAGSVVAVHPAAWFTVGMLTSAQEVLMMVFLLMLFISYHEVRDGKSRWTIVAVFSALCALFSKETAVILIPGGIVVYELTRSRKNYVSAAKTIWLWIAGIIVSYGILRWIAVPEVWRPLLVDMPVSEYIGTRLSIIIRTIHAISSLTPVAISDATRIVPVTGIGIGGAVFICVISGYIVWKVGMRHRLVRSFGLFALFLLPVLNILPLPRLWSPNYMYSVVVGYSGVVCVVLSMVKRYSPNMARLALIMMVVLVVVMGRNTFAAGSRLVSDYELFVPEVSRDPLFREGHFYLGSWYAKEGNDHLAETHFSQALRKEEHVISFVDEGAVRINLAGVVTKRKRYTEAEQLLTEVYNAHDPVYVVISLHNLAYLYDTSENYEASVALLSADQETVRQRPLLTVYIKHLLLLKRFDDVEQVLGDQRVLSAQEVMSIQSLIDAGRKT